MQKAKETDSVDENVVTGAETVVSKTSSRRWCRVRGEEGSEEEIVLEVRLDVDAARPMTWHWSWPSPVTGTGDWVTGFKWSGSRGDGGEEETWGGSEVLAVDDCRLEERWTGPEDDVDDEEDFFRRDSQIFCIEEADFSICDFAVISCSSSSIAGSMEYVMGERRKGASLTQPTATRKRITCRQQEDKQRP